MSDPETIRRPTPEAPLRVLNIAGARPNFMKIAPIVREMEKEPLIHPILIHTGQHYDKELSEDLFRELEIPAPERNLAVGSGSHAEQTARVMTAFEPVLKELEPDIVLVVGDVNSTIACALVATKLHVPVAHVEAGLRSFDRRMPEEVNRVLTDAISDYLFTTEPAGEENLLREGVPRSRIHMVGNVMIDTLLRFRTVAEQRPVLSDNGLVPGEYGVVTLHRPENVDSEAALAGIADALLTVGEGIRLVFPVHPRTRERLRAAGLEEKLSERVTLLPPATYLDFLGLMSQARILLTDSGGIQEEATVLGIPCLTLRRSTERPITLTLGTNRLVGADPDRIRAEAADLLSGDVPPPSVPEYWDGRAARRIVDVLIEGVGPRPTGP